MRRKCCICIILVHHKSYNEGKEVGNAYGIYCVEKLKYALDKLHSNYFGPLSKQINSLDQFEIELGLIVLHLIINKIF